MGAVAIIGGVVAFLALLLACPIQALLVYDGDFSLKAGIPFWRFPLFRDPEAKLSDPSVSPKKKRRILNALAKKEAKAEKKAEKKKNKKAKGKAQKKTPHSAAETLKKRKSKGPLRDLRFLLRSGLVIGGKLGKKLHVKVKRLEITVGSDDAAKTAYLYGAVSQGVAYTIATLDSYAKLRIKDTKLKITANFLQESVTFEGEILVSIRVGSVISLFFSALKLFIKEAFSSKTPDGKGQNSAANHSVSEKGSDHERKQA